MELIFTEYGENHLVVSGIEKTDLDRFLKISKAEAMYLKELGMWIVPVALRDELEEYARLYKPRARQTHRSTCFSWITKLRRTKKTNNFANAEKLLDAL